MRPFFVQATLAESKHNKPGRRRVMAQIRSYQPKGWLRLRRGLGLLAPLLCAAFIAACSTPRPSSMASALAAPLSDSAYKLDAGDKLRVIVFGEMDLGGEYEVDGSGFV